MAIFSFDLLVGIITLLVITRLNPYYTFGTRALYGVSYCLPLSREALDALSRKAPSKKAKGKNASEILSAENVSIYTRPIMHNDDMVGMPYFSEYNSIAVISLVLLVVFLVSETHACFRGPENSSDNVSFWLELASLWISFYWLFLVAKAYTNEAILWFIVGFIGFMIALTLLLAPGSNHIFDFDMRSGFEHVGSRAGLLAKALGLQLTTSLHLDVFRFVLAMVAGFITSATVYPAMGYGRLYYSCQTTKSISSFKKALATIDLVLPLLLVLCWIKPLTADLVLSNDLVKCKNTDVFRNCRPGYEGFFVTESNWQAFRFGLLIVQILLKLALFRSNMQLYLEDAKLPVLLKYLKPKAVEGEVVNFRIKTHLLKLALTALQYVGPVAAWLALAFMLKKKGSVELGVCAFTKEMAARAGVPSKLLPASEGYSLPTDAAPDIKPIHLDDGFSKEEIQALWTAVSGYQISTPSFFLPVVSFFIWWSILSFFVISVIGYRYWKDTVSSNITDMTQGGSTSSSGGKKAHRQKRS